MSGARCPYEPESGAQKAVRTWPGQAREPRERYEFTRFYTTWATMAGADPWATATWCLAITRNETPKPSRGVKPVTENRPASKRSTLPSVSPIVGGFTSRCGTGRAPGFYRYAIRSAPTSGAKKAVSQWEKHCFGAKGARSHAKNTRPCADPTLGSGSAGLA